MVLNPIFDSGVREGFQNWWYLSGILNNELATNNNMHKGTEANKQTKYIKYAETYKNLSGERA